MNHTTSSVEPARLAGDILEAIRNGRLVELESGLGRAVSLAHSGTPPEERAELLAAIAGQIRASLARWQADEAGWRPVEFSEAHLDLLRHIACG